tara:strand:- start:2530 stop:2856 length:327 start_codon:yes stop_codon:yes gene_type:complete
MSKHNKKEESIFDKMENMTGIPVMYLAIILAVVIIIVFIGIFMLPQDMLSFNFVGDSTPDPISDSVSVLTPTSAPTPAPIPETQQVQITPPNISTTISGGNVKIFKNR